MTRSHKFNEKDHAGLAEGTVLPHENQPKFFAKHGYEGVDPKKTKKNGGGKGNWGGVGSEVVDEDFNFAHPRRGSNASSLTNDLKHFKTKFEVNEVDPVFEEKIHGPEEDDSLAKTDSASTASSEDHKSM
ncbi:hypothetical protein F4780DRAFT_765303 [Xylariomycetidae sp. FL0641]|nr:hypothetical protein F4780DRAFT_765303 [Xylariomycetidae sp. FL0641]